MCLEQNEYEMIAKDTEALSREELKAVIDYWEDEDENLFMSKSNSSLSPN